MQQRNWTTVKLVRRRSATLFQFRNPDAPGSVAYYRGAMELRWLTTGDETILVGASSLFDNAIGPQWAATFLAQPGHHLCLAHNGDQPVGFVSGVELVHPDKGREMFLYELSVAEHGRRAGVGRALVTALAQRATALGCYGMWVLTDEDNAAARRTYVAAGADDPSEPCVLFNWPFSSG